MRQLLYDRRGVASVEYAILAVGLIAAVVLALAAFTPLLVNAFTTIGNDLTAATTTK